MSTKNRTATVTSLEAGQGRETGGADKPKPTKRRRTESSNGSSLVGMGYERVNTLRPACGPTAMRYVLEWAKSGSIGPSSTTNSVALHIRTGGSWFAIGLDSISAA